MDFLVHQVAEFGIQEGTIALLLMLPFVATFIAFARQIIGIRGFGIYITLILAYAFVATGLKYGLLIFFVVISAGTLIRTLIKKIRIMYLPRMAIILSGVTFSIFLLFLAGSFLKFEGLSAISIFPILVMTLIVERFVAAQIERGPRTAIFMTFETLLMATISYFLLEWKLFQQIVLDYSLLSIFILILLNYLLGRWTGLRISEYFRFRELIEYLELSSKKKK